MSKPRDADVSENQVPLIDLSSCGATSSRKGSCASSLDMDLSDPFSGMDPENTVSITNTNLSAGKKLAVPEVLVSAEDLIGCGDSESFPLDTPERNNKNLSELKFLENCAWNAHISPASNSDLSLQSRKDGVYHEVELPAVWSSSFASASHENYLLDSTPLDSSLPDISERPGSTSDLATPFENDEISEGYLSACFDSPTSILGMTLDLTSTNRSRIPPGSPDSKRVHSRLPDSSSRSCGQTSFGLLPYLEGETETEIMSPNTTTDIDLTTPSPAVPTVEISQYSNLSSSSANLSATGKISSTEVDSEHVLAFVIEDKNVVDIPTSSPPSSSPPYASKYFPSSSPLPSSSPAVSLGTPPTSPLPCTELKNNSYQSIESDEINTSDPRLEVGVSPTIQTEKAHQVISVIATLVGSSSDPAEERITETTEPPVSSPVPIVAKQSAETARDPLEHQENVRVPGPKRSTLAAQKVQHKKLAKPFRPLTLVQPARPQEPMLSTAFAGSPSGPNDADITSSLAASTPPAKMSDDKIKHRTTRAAAQFKSPLSASMVDSDVDSARPTPNIQLLERKLQLLKRAVKARENSEEEELERLIKKWTEAGREIAYEVWDLVKDNVANDSGGNPTQKRGFQESWGWEDAGDAKRLKTEERNWGWDVVPVDEREAEQEAQEYEEVGAKRKFVDDEDAPRHNLGVMLRELGIATEVLGWSEAEENFVDL
ncbi:hypothetical protein CPB83DRAFT_332434 [Crepidotus variabilis]|uniref:Uncharacterized protein n=1 Tax=Crepidotus variabilis TaxID=179855 RepID=A0A9P6JVV2_9AGAR|nr:hypothetical protein CPB83DRAFT_332434 [Crepidotus variabilis]